MTEKQSIQAGLTQLSEKLYRNQPDCVGVFSDLLDLLQVAFCDHEYEVRPMGGPPDMAESTERVRVCKLCGLEADED